MTLHNVDNVPVYIRARASLTLPARRLDNPNRHADADQSKART